MNYYSIESIINSKIISKLYNPKYITKNSNNSLFNLKVIFYLLSSLILTLLYFYQILSLVK